MQAEPGRGNTLAFIDASWPAPPNVHAVTTTRTGGYGTGAYESFNLALHVGDAPAAVGRNREALRQRLSLPSVPQWLEQVHGVAVVNAQPDGLVRRGDAAYTGRHGIVCAVLTADCLPVVICSRGGSEIAVAHCGWRGLADGVLQNTVQRFESPPGQLLAWLGPAISQPAFEVGAEVRDRFLDAASNDKPRNEAAFVPVPDKEGKYRADLYALASIRLDALGIGAVCGGGHCTVSQTAQFFSFRRDGATGRMATLVWMDPSRDLQAGERKT